MPEAVIARCSHSDECEAGRKEWTGPLDGRQKATVEYRCPDCERTRWVVEPLETSLEDFCNGGTTDV